jgi:hypothetical protein
MIPIKDKMPDIKECLKKGKRPVCRICFAVVDIVIHSTIDRNIYYYTCKCQKVLDELQIYDREVKNDY